MDNEPERQGLTIAEAVSQSPADIIGAVIKISVDAAHSRAQVLVADPSIPSNTYVRVSLSGPTVASLTEVSVGDVLRFNGLVLTNQQKETSLVGDFRTSWEQTETGWTRLYQRGTAIDACMDTNASRIRELVEWFTTSKFNDSIPSLPRRRMRLSEIHTAGIVCHVAARVTSFDTATSTNKARKRKRSTSSSTRSTFAVLTDGSNVMPFMDCGAHESALKHAIHSRQDVLLTNVVSACEGANHGDIVLRPTDSTRVVPMPTSLADSERKPPSGCLSLTQELSGVQTVVSPLVDVFIDELGVSLGDGKHFLSPNGFISTIIDSTSSPRYREATLTLDGLVVKAGASTMETLCGSTDATSLLKRGRFGRFVMDLIRGLLEEKTPITWTLDRGHGEDTYHVTSCFLPKL